MSLSLAAPASAAEPGSVEGLVVNGTEGGSSVSNQDITLKTYLDNTEVDSTDAKTDADGHFIFVGLSAEPGYSYQVTLAFQGADYYSEGLSFAEGETTKSTVVTVYDSTASDEAIQVATAHIVILVGQTSLLVEEYLLFNNEADLTYIGSRVVNTEGDKETLRFSLPNGATELRPVSGLMEGYLYSSEDGFVDTMPVLPGAKLIIYSYEIDYSSGTYEFSKRVNYPTASFILIVQGEGTKVTSDRLTVGEPVVDAEGIWFNYLSGQALASGDILDIHLSVLPETDNQNIVIWVTLALVVLGAGFGFSYLLRKKRLQPVSPEGSLSQGRQRLLVELAQLDDDFEAGKIVEENYHRLRKVKKSQLAELMQSPKEKSGNG